MDDALRITNVGITLTATSSVSSGVVLPNNGNGLPAGFTRIMAESGFAYIKVGTALVSNTLVATFLDTVVTANEALVLHTRGLTHISCIARSGTTILSCVPIEE